MSAYESLWTHESNLPESLKDPYLKVTPRDTRTGIQPRPIDVDKYVTGIGVKPYVEGLKGPRKGGYASLTNYRT